MTSASCDKQHKEHLYSQVKETFLLACHDISHIQHRTHDHYQMIGDLPGVRHHSLNLSVTIRSLIQIKTSDLTIFDTDDVLGQVGGNHDSQKGGGVNYLCLPSDPENGDPQSFDQ
jgi:hypothetical protein